MGVPGPDPTGPGRRVPTAQPSLEDVSPLGSYPESATRGECSSIFDLECPTPDSVFWVVKDGDSGPVQGRQEVRTQRGRYVTLDRVSLLFPSGDLGRKGRGDFGRQKQREVVY